MARVFYESSKQGQGIIARAKYNEGYYLADVYGRCSVEKARTWEQCQQKCMDMDGYNFHICSHNSFQYSVAWETDKAYYVETANHSYIVYKNR